MADFTLIFDGQATPNLQSIVSKIQTIASELDKDYTLKIKVDNASLNNAAKSIKTISTLLDGLNASSLNMDKGNPLQGFENLSNNIQSITQSAAALQEQMKTLSDTVQKNGPMQIGSLFNLSTSKMSKAQMDPMYTDTAAQLRERARAIEEYFAEYYKVQDRFEGLIQAAYRTRDEGLSSTIMSPKYTKERSKYDTAAVSELGKDAAVYYEKYIADLQNIADKANIDLTPITSQWEQTATEMNKDTASMTTSASQTEAALDNLKQIFSSGINSEQLTNQLNNINTALQDILSTLTDTDRLSEAMKGLREAFNIGGDSASITATLDAVNTSLKELSNTMQSLHSAGPASIATATEQAVQTAKSSISQLNGEVQQLGDNLELVQRKTVTTDNEVQSVTNSYANKDKSIRKDVTGSTTVTTQRFITQSEIAAQQEKEAAQHTKEILDAKKAIANLDGKIASQERTIAKNSISGDSSFVKVIDEAKEKSKQLKESISSEDFNYGDFRRQLQETEISLKNNDTALSNHIAKLKEAADAKKEAAKSEQAAKKEADATLKAEQKRIADEEKATAQAQKAAERQRIADEKAAQKEAATREKEITSASKLYETTVAGIDKSQKNFDKLGLPANDERYTNFINGIKEYRDGVREAFATYNQSGKKPEDFNTLKSSLNGLANSFKTVQQAANEAAASEKQDQSAFNSYTKTVDEARYALTNFTAAKNSSKDSSQQAYSTIEREKAALEGLYKSYQNGDITYKQFTDGIKSSASNIHNAIEIIKQDETNVQSFADRMGGAMQKFAAWFSGYRIVMTAIRTMKQLVSTAIEVDDAMTQLKIVTNESDEAYANYAENVAKRAQDLGTSITDMIGSTTTFARLGYNLEDSSQLASMTSMLQEVGDIDVSDAQDAMTSIIKAFNIDISDVESTMDKLVTVGNNFPISVEQIAEAMTNASSALSAAGNSFDESVALVTAANTTMQNASKSSTGLRTLVARLRKSDTELDELGESMTTAKYEEMVNALTKIQLMDGTTASVSLTDINGQFRSTYDIIADIAAVWDKMSTNQQAALAETLAGTRQQAVFFSLVENFKEASGAMDAMANSSGAMSDAYGVYLDSITAHINSFKAAFQGLGSDLVDADITKAVVDIGTFILNAADGAVKIVNALGGLKTILPMATVFFGTLYKDRLLNAATKAFTGLTNNIRSFGAAIGEVSTTWSSFIRKRAGLGAPDFEKTVAEGLGLPTDTSLAAFGTVMGVAAMAATAAVLAYDQLYMSTEEYAKAADEARGKLQETKEESEDIKDQQEDLRTELVDLANKYEIEVTDDDSIDDIISKLETLGELSKQDYAKVLGFKGLNMGLENQAALIDQMYQGRLVEAATAASNYLNSRTATWYTGELDERGNSITETGTPMDQTLAYQTQMIQTQTELNELREQEAKLIKEGKTDTAEFSDVQQQIADKTRLVSDLSKLVSSNMEEILKNYSSLFDDKGNVLPGMESTVEATEQFLEQMGESANTMQGLVAESDAMAGSFESSIKRMEEALESLSTHMSDVSSALKDSMSATGLTTDEIDKLTAAYKDLAGFDATKLFEETANGVHLNRDELKRLDEQLANSKIEEQAQLIQDIEDKLYKARANGEDTSGLEKDLFDAKLLMSQYEGLLSAYNKWVQAKSGGSEKDSYEEIGKYYDTAKQAVENGWWGDEGLNTYLDLMLSAEQRTGDAQADFATLTKTIEGTTHSLADYWKYNSDNELISDGLIYFLEDVNSLLGDEYAMMDENGNWKFDFDGDKLQDVANAFGTTTEMVEQMERALISAGAQVDLSDETLLESIEKAQEKAKGLEYFKADEVLNAAAKGVLDFDASELTFDELKDKIVELDTLKAGIDVNVEGGQEATDALDELISKCSEEYYLQLNAKTDGDLNEAVAYVEEFQKLRSGYDGTLSDATLNEYAHQLAALDSDVQLAIGIDKNNVGNVEGIIDQLTNDTITIPVEFETRDFDTLNERINSSKTALEETFSSNSKVFSGGFSERVRDTLFSLDETSGIEEYKNAIDALNGIKIDVDVAGADAAQQQIADLKAACEEKYYLQLNVKSGGDLDAAAGYINRLKAEIEGLGGPNDINIKTSVQGSTEIADIASQLAGLDKDVQIAIGILPENTGDADAILQQIASLPTKIDIPVGFTAVAGDVASTIQQVDGEDVGDKSVTVDAVDNASPIIDSIQGKLNALRSKTITVTTNEVTVKSTINNGSSSGKAVGGSFRAAGTTGANAYASGHNWGIPKNEQALINELGSESIVRDGRWSIIPGGAHLINLKRGDIIFNAKQTEELLKSGAVSSNGGHGTPAYDSGSGRIGRSSSGSNTNMAGNPVGSNYVAAASAAAASAASSAATAAQAAKETENEIVDWIEIAIDRVERTIDSLAKIAESAFRTLTDRLTAIDKEIPEVEREISLQRQGYERYLRQAGSVGLDEGLANLVRNGTIDIAEYDKDTAELIKDYQEWYEKALDCQEAVEDLTETLGELYTDKFENIEDDFDNQLSLLEHMINTYDEGVDYIEERGYLATTKFYEAKQRVLSENISVMEDELNSLIDAMSDAINSGYIAEGSEQWFDFQNSINDVKESIQETETEMAELAQTIREVSWDRFDYLLETIEDINDEAKFMIDLMSSSKLISETGDFTEAGLASVGMYGERYNIYMAQADEYASEIKALNAEIAKDPNNTKLLDRRNDLLKAQRDNILAAEDEKEAIVDLVEQGIDKQLESMKKLIDSYTDALDEAKNLYDYQKKVKEQTSEIASLEKQMSAYARDDSEETRATVQKIKVSLQEARDSLQETEYDRYVSEQKKMLDDLYTEYETILNMRLDDIDALVSDMIEVTNDNANRIRETIYSSADKVGYTLTEATQSIWDNDGAASSIIADYGDNFLSLLTSVNFALNKIAETVGKMAGESTAMAIPVINNTSASTPVRRYASGGLARETGFAWLDGTRRSPEVVLSQADSRNFLSLKQAMESVASGTSPLAAMFGKKNTDLLSSLSGVSAPDSEQNSLVGDITYNINIPIDHVEDYDDFMNRMRTDDKFESMIQAITIDRLTGGSKIAKNKYKWR